MIKLIIDSAEVKAKAGDNLLWIALDNGFYVPNLCAIRDVNPQLASCRLCFIEIDGRPTPVTSCTETAKDGMSVRLSTLRVQRVRRTAFALLMSHHHLDCRNCAKNRNCELQRIATCLNLKLKPKRLKGIPRQLSIDSSHPLFTYDRNKCVLCGKCVWICHKQGTGILDFAFRGISTVVTTIADISLAEAGCSSCLECVAVCPVGALVAKTGVPMNSVHATVAHRI